MNQFGFGLDDSLYSYSPSTEKQQQQSYIAKRSYADLLVDDEHLSSMSNCLNEQRQPILLIDERDLNS